MADIIHISFVVRNDLMYAETRFWDALGFGRITRPEPKYRGQWLQSGSLCVFLRPGVTTPDEWGHTAIVPRLGLDVTMERLEKEPFITHAEVAEDYMGARRIFVLSPTGHRLELVEFRPPARFPPPPVTD